MRTAWAPKARRPTSKSIHVWPSSPSVWFNHILCSCHFDCLYLSNIQILLFVHVDQVFHMFRGAIPPSLMVFWVKNYDCGEKFFDFRPQTGGGQYGQWNFPKGWPIEQNPVFDRPLWQLFWANSGVLDPNPKSVIMILSTTICVWGSGWHNLRVVLTSWLDPEFGPQNAYVEILATFATKMP